MIWAQQVDVALVISLSAPHHFLLGFLVLKVVWEILLPLQTLVWVMGERHLWVDQIPCLGE